MIINHENETYKRTRLGSGYNQYNGAYYYSKEICDTIIPRVTTDRPWVTVNCPPYCADHAIFFIHSNVGFVQYDWLANYRDLILICGLMETVTHVAHLGRAVYLPLSIDVEYVRRFRTEKTKEVCFVGRPEKREGIVLEPGTEFIEGVPREELLRELAKYKRAYAVGRCALEALALGCEVLPYDPRFPNPNVWKVVDNKDAATLLQATIDSIDGGKEL